MGQQWRVIDRALRLGLGDGEHAEGEQHERPGENARRAGPESGIGTEERRADAPRGGRREPEGVGSEQRTRRRERRERQGSTGSAAAAPRSALIDRTPRDGARRHYTRASCSHARATAHRSHAPHAPCRPTIQADPFASPKPPVNLFSRNQEPVDCTLLMTCDNPMADDVAYRREYELFSPISADYCLFFVTASRPKAS